MKFTLNEDKLKKVIEVFLNKELQSLKEWLSGVDELSNLFYEYDESYIKAIERVDKIEVIKLYRHTFQITNDESWRVDIIIYSNVGDFDWDMLTYDLSKKLENLFGVRSIGIVVEDYKWSHKQENED